MSRIDDLRTKNRFHIAVEELLEPDRIIFRPVRHRKILDASLFHLLLEILIDGFPLAAQLARIGINLLELRLGIPARLVINLVRMNLIQFRQTSNPDRKELIQVRRKDGNELHPLQ